jgi:hypothetical protein
MGDIRGHLIVEAYRRSAPTRSVGGRP